MTDDAFPPRPPETTTHPGQAPPAATDLPPRIGRYRVEGEIARGGMGVVYRAHDPDLMRELALKVLLDRHHDRPEIEQRFLEEARVGGQLQHPGIVPVHELGRDAGQRPYFTMKLVQGRTLPDLLKERDAGAAPRAEGLPRFVQVFEQVAQTLAYAHAHGVIHRDLKPANVMVGEFGEVQVMDWGLAKVIGPAGGEAGGDGLSTVQVVRTERGAPDGSLAGSVLGTPAYMAPEQARGAVHEFDRRTDVFGLGAVLCEILTGQPPYVAEGAEVLLRAAEADLADALSRLERCEADAELVSLARACLAPAREARPRDAGEVARRVTAYRAGVERRLRQAEVGRAEARAKAAEARKRQRLTVALAAAVVLALGLGGGGAWYLRQLALERSAASGRLAALVDADLVEVGDRLARAGNTPSARGESQRALLADARTALERAEGRLGESDDGALRERVGRARREWEGARRDREMLDRLDEARLRAASFGDGGFDEAGSDRLYGEAFAWYGIDVEGLGPGEAASRLRASALAAELLDALDDWARSLNALDARRMRRVWEVADELDGSAWRRHLRRAFRTNDKAEILRLAGEAPADLSSAAVGLLARALDRAGEPARGLTVLRQAQRRRPGDFWLAFDLASACPRSSPEGREEAARYWTAALALRPDSPAVHNNLGSILHDQGKSAEAVAEFHEALRLKPDLAAAHCNLGNVLVDQGKLAEAVAEFNEAIRLQPTYPLAHRNLGVARRAQGKLPEAVAAFRNAICLQPHDAATHNDLAGVLHSQGELDEAVAEFRKALLLKKDDAEVHNNLGATLAARGKLAEAVAEFREALRLKPDFAGAHSNLGIALTTQRKLPEAMAHFKEALRLQPDLADAHVGRGVALQVREMLPEAVAEYREAIRLKPGFPEAHVHLGNALHA